MSATERGSVLPQRESKADSGIFGIPRSCDNFAGELREDRWIAQQDGAEFMGDAGMLGKKVGQTIHPEAASVETAMGLFVDFFLLA